MDRELETETGASTDKAYLEVVAHERGRVGRAGDVGVDDHDGIPEVRDIVRTASDSLGIRRAYVANVDCCSTLVGSSEKRPLTLDPPDGLHRGLLPTEDLSNGGNTDGRPVERDCPRRVKGRKDLLGEESVSRRGRTGEQRRGTHGDKKGVGELQRRDRGR